MHDSWAQKVEAARDDRNRAGDLASAGQVLKAVSAYNSALKQYNDVLRFGNINPPPEGLSDEEYEEINSEMFRTLSELQDLLAQQLTPDRDLAQAEAIIEGFRARSHFSD